MGAEEVEEDVGSEETDKEGSEEVFVDNATRTVSSSSR
jgi:hypothetical protein